MGQNRREIKFRCFATTFPNKPMAFRYFNLSRAEDINRFRDCIISNPSSRMNQFTGLKDKNGKEIYEGDIVEFKLDEFFTPYYWTVKIPNIYFTMTNWTVKIPNIYFTMKNQKRSFIKIIGNIYENPELLDKLSSEDNEK